MYNAIKIADTKFEKLSDLEKIRIGVNLLVDKNISRPELFDAIKESVDEFGPYFVFDNGVAVAHAAPSDNSLEVGVSLISSKTGFNLFEKNINILFTLSVPKDGDHMALLQKVILAVRDEDEKEKILNLSAK